MLIVDLPALPKKLQARTLLRKGWRVDDIAVHFSEDVSTIQEWLIPEASPRPRGVKRRIDYDQVKRLDASGLRNVEISTRLKISHNSVSKILGRWGTGTRRGPYGPRF